MPKNETRPYSRVLIMRFSALGDVAIAVPVVYPLCHANPDVQFFFATQPRIATILINRPKNLTVIPLDVKGDEGSARKMWQWAKKIRKQFNIDAVADIHSVLRTWVVDSHMRLHGVKVVRIDKGRSEKRALTSQRINRQLTTSGERYKNVFAQLELDTSGEFTSILHDINPAEEKFTIELPTKRASERWIAIAPFSQHEGKVYPMDLMLQVIDSLAALPDVKLFLMGGGKKEREALEPIEQKYENATSMAAIKHDFIDEFHLFSLCDAMVSMDSANMHLASLVGLLVVSVWGATHPYCGFMGWGQSEENAVQRTDLDCRPCSVFGQKPCKHGDYQCLNGISPNIIVEKIKKIIHL